MIYFIKSKNHVKIGYSKNPEERLAELQTGNPIRLKLLATFPGDAKTEKGLHEAFAKYHWQGEWFRFDGHLKASVIALKEKCVPFEITDVRSLQQAGHHLQIRQRSNRLLKKNNTKIKTLIREAV